GFHFDTALNPKVRSAAIGFLFNPPLPVCSRSADARNRHSSRHQAQRDVHSLVGVVVDDCRNRRQVACDEKARRLQAHNQRLFRARGGRGDAELISLGRYTRRRPPARERIGEFHFEDGLAVLVGDDLRLPETCRAEIAANLAGRLLSRRLDGRLGSPPGGVRDRSEFIKAPTEALRISLGRGESAVYCPVGSFHTGDSTLRAASWHSTISNYSPDDSETICGCDPIFRIKPLSALVLASQHQGALVDQRFIRAFDQLRIALMLKRALRLN